MARPSALPWPAWATTALASLLLFIPLVVGLVGAATDSAVIDELAHIPAGASYVLRQDFRLNPEHPPLVKDLAGLSLASWAYSTGRPLVFPAWLPEWQRETNSEWAFGWKFLYTFNRADAAFFLWARLPLVLTSVGFALWLFVWVRRRWGAGAALIALALIALSPTFLGHARYVTTDVPATVAFLTATAALLAWLDKPGWKAGVLAALAVGLALLVKFSLLLFLPLALAALALRSLAHGLGDPSPWPVGRRLAGFGLILVGAVLGLVWPVYLAHVRHYPVTKQQADFAAYDVGANSQTLVRAVGWGTSVPGLRALAHYAAGALLVANRSQFGSTVFFRGHVTTGGQWEYFPTLALVKEPLPAIGLVGLGLGLGCVNGLRALRARRGRRWVREHWVEGSLLAFIVLYWAISLGTALNIGVRHVLPTFPFAWVLAAAAIAGALRRLALERPRLAQLGAAVIGLLLVWQAWSVLRVGVGQLGYFNELAGGLAGGSEIAADSNLDWGQDLRRLGQFVRQRGIERIAVDYFGGGNLALDVGPAAVDHNAEDGPVTGWFAISETYRTLEAGLENRYAWLEAYKPVVRIGTSLLVYDLPKR